MVAIRGGCHSYCVMHGSFLVMVLLSAAAVAHLSYKNLPDCPFLYVVPLSMIAKKGISKDVKSERQVRVVS